MPILLRNCPHLEILVLEALLHYVTDQCGDACDCVSRDGKGHSLLSCPVKNLQIKGFRGTVREEEVIRHFMVSFPCLEEVELAPSDNEHIFDLHGASSSASPPPPPQEMSQEDCFQKKLDDVKAEIADPEALFDIIADQKPVLATALRARRATGL